jgi:hypothetical protein
MQILIARRPTAQNCDSYIALRYQLLQCRKRFAARFATFPHFPKLIARLYTPQKQAASFTMRGRSSDSDLAASTRRQ